MVCEHSFVINLFYRVCDNVMHTLFVWIVCPAGFEMRITAKKLIALVALLLCIGWAVFLSYSYAGLRQKSMLRFQIEQELSK